MIAAELQRAGRSVVVLERAAYRNEADFRQLEARRRTGAVPPRRALLLRDGLDGTPRRRDTRRRHRDQLDGLPSPARPDPRRVGEDWGCPGSTRPEFDDHLDAVSQRINVNTEATKPNRVNKMMLEALEASAACPARSCRATRRSTTTRSYCGYCNAGCQQGCKQSTLKTYLQDASDAGTRFVVGCAVDRVLVQRRPGRRRCRHGARRGRLGDRADGRGAGRGGRRRRARVAGAASPQRNRRPGGRHDTCAFTPPTSSRASTTRRCARGTASSRRAVSFAFAEAVQGSGFLVESVNLSLPFWASAMAVHERGGAQGADARPPTRSDLARRLARHGQRRGRARRRRASRSCAGRSTIRSTAPSPRAPTSSSPGCTARGARARSSPSTGTTPRGARATTSTRTSPGSRPRRTRGSRTRPTRWAPAASAPIQRPRSRARGASCTTSPACGSATPPRCRLRPA